MRKLSTLITYSYACLKTEPPAKVREILPDPRGISELLVA